MHAALHFPVLSNFDSILSSVLYQEETGDVRLGPSFALSASLLRLAGSVNIEHKQVTSAFGHQPPKCPLLGCSGS